MPALDDVLRELESATAAIKTVPVENFAEAKAAMDRRKWAVADVSELTSDPRSLPDEVRENTLERLRIATQEGAQAIQRLIAAKREAMVEWNRLSHLYRAFGGDRPSKPKRIDCRG